MRDTVLTLKRLFGEEWKNLMLLSIAAAVFSLPLITIGPSLLALHGVLMRIMDGTCDLDRFREFRSLFRACFWRGLMLEAAAAGYLLVMFWCVALQDAMGSGKAALQTALWVSLFLAGGVAVYLIPLLADKSLSGQPGPAGRRGPGCPLPAPDGPGHPGAVWQHLPVRAALPRLLPALPAVRAGRSGGSDGIPGMARSKRAALLRRSVTVSRPKTCFSVQRSCISHEKKNPSLFR